MRNDVPAAFHSAVMNGIAEGEKRMKMRNKLKFAAAAAVLVIAIVFAASAYEPMADITLSQGATQAAEPTPVAPVLTPTPEMFETVEPTPQPEKETYVYATERGIWYHSDPACSDMQNPRCITVKQAIEELLEPCRTCIEKVDGEGVTLKFADNVWMTEYGVYYHTIQYCSGMMNASAVKRSYAEQRGKKPCPMCSGLQFSIPPEADVYGRLEELMPGALGCYIGMYGYENLYASAVCNEYWTLMMSCEDGPLVEISTDVNGTTVSFYLGVNPDIREKLFQNLSETRIRDYEQAVLDKIDRLDEEGAAGYALTSIIAGFTENDTLYNVFYVHSSQDKRFQTECDAETGSIYSFSMEMMG